MLGTLHNFLTKTRKFKVAAYVTFLFIFSLAFLTSEVSALELTQNVTPKYAATGYTFSNSTFDNCSFYFDNTLISNSNQDITCNVSLLYINGANRNYNVGDFIVVSLYGTSNREGSDFESQMRANVGVRVTGSGSVDLLDIRSQEFSANSYSWNFIFRVTTAGSVRNLELYNSSFSGFYLFPQENLISGSITSYEPLSVNASISGTVNVNLDSVLNSLNTIQSNQLVGNTKLEQIRYGVEQIYLEIVASNSATQTAIDNNTQKMQDIHDDEVDRIETGVSDGQSSVDDLDTSLSPVNPITWLFSGLEVHNCYDISQLAGFIHAPSSIYCSWFSNSTRNIVSPVINLFATIVIIGFAYSWLKKGGL